MARATSRDAIIEVLSEGAGIEIEEIIAETGYSNSTVWRVMSAMSHDGVVKIVGSRKTSPSGKRALYALIGDVRPVFDESPMRKLLGRLRDGLITEFGPFAVLAAQVTQ